MRRDNIANTVDVAESLRDMGAQLQKIRVEKELSLEAIAQQTRVPLIALTAIESGNLAELPELVYVRGFVRRYAEALNQDVASFDLGQFSSSLTLAPFANRQRLDLGRLLDRIKYPLYGGMVLLVGCGLIYLNNRKLAADPVESQPAVPVVSQSH